VDFNRAQSVRKGEFMVKSVFKKEGAVRRSVRRTADHIIGSN